MIELRQEQLKSMNIKFTMTYQGQFLVSEEVEFGPDSNGREPSRLHGMFTKALLDYEDDMIKRYIHIKVEELSKQEL